MSAWRSRCSRFFFSGGSAERLGATRLLLGLGMLPFHVLQYHNLLQVDWGGARWYYLDRIWYFDVLGIEYHAPVVTTLAFASLLAATLCFAVGYHTRLAAWCSLLLILYLKGARDSIAGDIHHREIIPFQILLFFALSRSGDVFSLDARAPTPRRIEEWEASWPIRASQLYTAVFYFWSGIAKLRASGTGWVTDGVGLQNLLLRRSVRFGVDESGSPAGSALALWLAQYPDWLPLFSLGVVAFELGFPLLLFMRARWLRLGFLAGVTFFHVANFVLMNVKFLFLPVVFVVFFDAAAILRALRALARRCGFVTHDPARLDVG